MNFHTETHSVQLDEDYLIFDWLISHKIRHAIMQSDRKDPLTGAVRVHRTSYDYSDYLNAHQPLVVGGSFTRENDLQQVKIKQPDPTHVDAESRMTRKMLIWMNFVIALLRLIPEDYEHEIINDRL